MDSNSKRKPKRIAPGGEQPSQLDYHFMTLFAEHYVDLISVSFVDEDSPAGKALVTSYKPPGKRRHDLGSSTLIKATFYVSGHHGCPSLLTVTNRCYGMTKKSERKAVVAEYRREAIRAAYRPGAKLPYRLRCITLEPSDWQCDY
jgi:hypothetical protein